MKPLLSIVIPTHKRPAILKECLEHLEKQTIAGQIEVIVVSDGPDPETAKIFEKPTSYQLPATSYFEIPKSQQGIARNEGVKHASADLTLFIGDDIFLAPNACELHVQAHRNSQFSHSGLRASGPRTAILHSQFCAVLGHTTWDPACGINDVMRWLEKSGWQFGYPMIQKYAQQTIPKQLQHRFTYTSHISLPTEIAKKYPFRSDVSLYGWEDILWGTELRDADIALIYEPNAKALHHHHIELADSLKRMKTIGESLKKMQEIDPTFDRIPHGWKLWAHQLMSLLPTMRGKHEKAFFEGLHR